ncbi:hypothetical protein GCM10027091_38950 [Streptomyces daliensis]
MNVVKGPNAHEGAVSWGPCCQGAGWALEGTVSYGAGLAAFLEDAGERVIEVCCPTRPTVRGADATPTCSTPAPPEGPTY